MPIYTPVTWSDEVPGESPIKYIITDDVNGELGGSATIAMKTAPTVGTSLNATNMNHIEQGILDATMLTHRQGGSSTDWNSPGSTNYTPASVRIQCGMVTSNPSADVTVTYPVAFSYKPLIFPSTYSSGNLAITFVNQLAGSFGFSIYEDGVRTTLNMFWLAIGPA